MAPLVALGEETGTTFLVVCHTNKRKGASGRDRIADSADLWDISRSVLMMGWAEEQGARYISNEKNNYACLQETILFTIDGEGMAEECGHSWKRDKEFMQEVAISTSAPKRDGCKAWVLGELNRNQGRISVKTLEEAATREGYTAITLRRAKDDLKKDGRIKYKPEYKNGEKTYFMEIVQGGLFREIPEDGDAPF